MVRRSGVGARRGPTGAARGVKFVSIPTRDQDRALAFWTTRVGLRVATDQPFSETQRWIEPRVPGADTRFVLVTRPGHEDRVGGFAPLALWSDDLDATYERLTAAGVVDARPAAAGGLGGLAAVQGSGRDDVC